MAKVILCSDGFDVSDQVFTVDIESHSQIDIFVKLVKEGGIAIGLIKPAVRIKSKRGEQVASQKNNWFVDTALL